LEKEMDALASEMALATVLAVQDKVGFG